jgi:hypothetical protein
MKTLLVLALLGVGGFLGYRYLFPEKRACGKMVELCGADAATGQRCEQAIVELKKAAGGDSARSAAACVADAQSCPQALGCMAGLVGQAAGGAANEFLKGLQKSLGH